MLQQTPGSNAQQLVTCKVFETPRNTARRRQHPREQVPSETLSCRDVSGESRLREHSDSGEGVSKGRHHLRGLRCLYR